MALNILVVDDSETVRDIIAKTLELAQIPLANLFEASNGQEALDVLGQNQVDLVLSDINMPVMGGVEMIKRMQSNERTQAVPVVVVSTEGSATRIEELKANGVRAYIRKPFTPELMRNVISEVMGGLGHEDP